MRKALAVKRWGGNLALMVGSLVLALLLCELSLRVIGFENPRFAERSSQLGYRLHPGARAWYRHEGGSYVTINSEGLRDREHAKLKPANTFRIAVLGDSYAAAFAVPMEQAFWWVMQDSLNACAMYGGKSVEVVNFGVDGYGTAQELLTLEHYAWDYDPDVVLLAFFPGNDIRNNSKVLEPDKLRPFFSIRNGRLKLDTSFVDTPEFNRRKSQILGSFRERWLSYHSRTYQLFGLLRRTMIQREGETRSGNVVGSEIGVDAKSFVAPVTDDWSNAWLITEALIERMRDEAEAKGARFLVVSLTIGIQVDPDSAIRNEYARSLGVADLEYPERRLRSLGQRERIEVLTLAPMLLSYAEKNNEILHGFFRDHRRSTGHYNKVGHRVAGETIAEYLCRPDGHERNSDGDSVESDGRRAARAGSSR